MANAVCELLGTEPEPRETEDCRDNEPARCTVEVIRLDKAPDSGNRDDRPANAESGNGTQQPAIFSRFFRRLHSCTSPAGSRVAAL